MDAFVYQGALYCPECAAKIAGELAAQGVKDAGETETFPQGPHAEGGGEADSPQHCDAGEGCAGAEQLGDRKVGAFLENPLTDEGRLTVMEAFVDDPASPVVQRWMEHYGIEPPEEDEGEGEGEGEGESEDDSPNELLPPFDQTHLETWFERDRAHVALYDSESGELLQEWWDDDLRDAIEGGFLDPRNLHRSAYDYFVHLQGPAGSTAT
jgi:hypothetical protein